MIILVYLNISTNSYLHAYITYNLRAMTSFKIASLHLVIPCWNDLKEKVQNESCIRVLVVMRFPLGHSAEQTLLATSGHPEPLVPQNFYAAYMCLVSQVTSQWSKRCYSLQRQGRLGKTPRLGQRGQLSEARRSFHSFNANVALHIIIIIIIIIIFIIMLPSLKQKKSPENWWLDTFVWGRPIFRGYVCFRESTWHAYNVITDVMMSSGSLCWIMIISDMGVVHGLDESAPKIAKRDRCRGACTVHNVVGQWHPCKPCRCCLTAALDALFETLLLECCCIVVFGLPALLFPWQFQQRLFRQSTKAKTS